MLLHQNEQNWYALFICITNYALMSNKTEGAEEQHNMITVLWA